jgi:hypothetical protein
MKIVVNSTSNLVLENFDFWFFPTKYDLAQTPLVRAQFLNNSLCRIDPSIDVSGIHLTLFTINTVS